MRPPAHNLKDSPDYQPAPPLRSPEPRGGAPLLKTMLNRTTNNAGDVRIDIKGVNAPEAAKLLKELKEEVHKEIYSIGEIGKNFLSAKWFLSYAGQPDTGFFSLICMFNLNDAEHRLEIPRLCHVNARMDPHAFASKLREMIVAEVGKILTLELFKEHANSIFTRR